MEALIGYTRGYSASPNFYLAKMWSGGLLPPTAQFQNHQILSDGNYNGTLKEYTYTRDPCRPEYTINGDHESDGVVIGTASPRPLPAKGPAPASDNLNTVTVTYII